MTIPASGPVDPLDQRISDTDRTAALGALQTHLEAGRLDVNEFSDRSAKVTTARTARDLTGLFDDLPGTVPVGAAQLATRPTSSVQPVAPPVPVPYDETRAGRLVSSVSGIAAAVAVILFFALSSVLSMPWLVFLLVPIAGGITKLIVERDKP